MKPFRKVLCALLLLFLLPSILLAAEISTPALYGDTYYAELPEMLQRIKTTEGPRLILVGNSDVAFGVQGELLETLLRERGFDFTVCPFGLYGAVGTAAMLSLSQKELRPGDLAVLIIEPTADTNTAYFGANAFWKCMETQPELFFSLNGEQRRAMAGAWIPFLQERWDIRRSGILPKGEGVYARDAFNERCDMVFPREGNRITLGYDPAATVDFSAFELSDEFTAMLRDYCRQAEEKGAAAVASFSPVNRSAVDSMDGLNRYFTAVNEAVSCPVISDPSRYILDAGWFYDSNLHLNSSGAKLRTLLLAEDLLCFLGSYAPLTVEMPDMPPSIAPVPEDLEDDEAAFTYEALPNGGWMISGLLVTSKTSLILPAVHEGEPVVGIQADALAEADAVEEITIPAGIAALPDGLFAPCTSLKRLVFAHRETMCRVGEKLLEDAENVVILVPRQDDPLYRDGIGCDVNPWLPYLKQIRTY